MDLNTILGSFMSGASRLIGGIKTLAVPRIEDMPYATSPPIQFIYQSTADLFLGTYTWADPPSPLTALRPIRTNTIYFFRNITLTADIEELDFTANISSIAAAPMGPQFYSYLNSDSNAVMFREPLIMNKFYQQFVFPYAWRTQQEDDQIVAAFNGQLAQGPGLLGKASITLKAVISAQEIVDDSFGKLFWEKYPAPTPGGAS